MRKEKRKLAFMQDTQGVFELPVQYMIAVIVAGIVILLISVAGYQLWKDVQVKKAREEVDKIVNEAELMYSTAAEGSKQTININFPSGMKKVVFGSSNPKNANHYYILMDWGQNESFYSKNANFSVAVLYPGISSVTLELIKINNGGGKYVKITPS